MPVFKSKINVSSDSFKENRKQMLELINKLDELNARAPAISASKKPKFDKRGQLLPRERLARLLDPGMPYLEISNIAGYMLDTKKEEKSIPGSSIMAGIGYINGVRTAIVVDDSGIKAGSLTTAGGYRLQRAQEIALKQKLPFVPVSYTHLTLPTIYSV